MLRCRIGNVYKRVARDGEAANFAITRCTTSQNVVNGSTLMKAESLPNESQ